MEALQQLADWPVDHVAAAVIAPGREVAAYGDADRVFALASVTKLLVAQAVLVAVEEGALDLDTPAGPPGATVAHLLSHASGLGPSTGSGGANGSGGASGSAGSNGRDAVAEPGTQRIYSSAGYEVLAETVEDATGIAFGDYLREAVCEPLGMTRTSLTGSAGHGASSSVADLTRFAADLLTPRLLSPRTADRAREVWFPGIDGFTPGYGKFRPNDWGLGPELKGTKNPHWTAPSHSPETFGHFGQAGTFLWVDPVRKAAAVVLTDRPFGPWAKPLWSETNEGILADLSA
ncbi:serine hydrolase [Gordonia sp. (in: high G+C Gram-positive bacteria)]|uniref:serine hydrolase domain-containing protein n=1 Tax=Gordonia sp. (in: high G+C Gram-positive bacteria) TaxID=84139 RepID=UPI00263524D8|nr:serine hydrolase domain-containing protein [Gordonia sp. (in: high G+C Gram-positive bacteria)]